nr:MAG TPA: hypothetical protein [Caudoviricetes sp.]
MMFLTHRAMSSSSVLSPSKLICTSEISIESLPLKIFFHRQGHLCLDEFAPAVDHLIGGRGVRDLPAVLSDPPKAYDQYLHFACFDAVVDVVHHQPGPHTQFCVELDVKGDLSEAGADKLGLIFQPHAAVRGPHCGGRALEVLRRENTAVGGLENQTEAPVSDYHGRYLLLGYRRGCRATRSLYSVLVVLQADRSGLYIVRGGDPLVGGDLLFDQQGLFEGGFFFDRDLFQELHLRGVDGDLAAGHDGHGTVLVGLNGAAADLNGPAFGGGHLGGALYGLAVCLGSGIVGFVRGALLVGVLLAVYSLPAICGLVVTVPHRADDHASAATVREVPHENLVADLGHPVFPCEERQLRSSAAILIFVGNSGRALRVVDAADLSDAEDIAVGHWITS